jgi:hypothetical protein
MFSNIHVVKILPPGAGMTRRPPARKLEPTRKVDEEPET